MNNQHFYQLEMDDRPKVIGIRDGTSQAWATKEFWANHPQLKQFINSATDYRVGRKPDFNAEWIGLQLDKSSKHTDFIDMAGLFTGYFVSDKLKDVLESHHLPDHSFYKVEFLQKEKKGEIFNKVSGYWWFYFEKETGEINIDFPKSVFDLNEHKRRWPEKNFSIKEFSDYKRVYTETPPALLAKKLVFRPSFDKDLDIWGASFLSIRKYISPRLLNSFKEAGITGYQVQEPVCELVFEE